MAKPTIESPVARAARLAATSLQMFGAVIAEGQQPRPTMSSEMQRELLLMHRLS